MKYLYFIICVFVLLCCYACRQNETIDLAKIDVDVNKATPLNYTEFFTDLNYIPLETSTRNYLVDIDRIKITDSLIVVMEYSRDGRKFHFFDRMGRFISNIGSNGEGPGKFLRSYDFYINESDRTLEIVDGAQQKLIVYALDGTHIRDVSLGYSFERFAKLDNDQYAFYASNSPIGNDGLAPYKSDYYTEWLKIRLTKALSLC